MPDPKRSALHVAEVIEVLEDALLKARNGTIVSVCIVGAGHDGTIYDAVVAPTHALLGGMTVVQVAVAHQLEDAEREEGDGG